MTARDSPRSKPIYIVCRACFILMLYHFSLAAAINPRQAVLCANLVVGEAVLDAESAVNACRRVK